MGLFRPSCCFPSSLAPLFPPYFHTERLAFLLFWHQDFCAQSNQKSTQLLPGLFQRFSILLCSFLSLLFRTAKGICVLEENPFENTAYRSVLNSFLEEEREVTMDHIRKIFKYIHTLNLLKLWGSWTSESLDSSGKYAVQPHWRWFKFENFPRSHYWMWFGLLPNPLREAEAEVVQERYLSASFLKTCLVIFYTVFSHSLWDWSSRRFPEEGSSISGGIRCECQIPG